jgi:hypothetical protein
MTVIWDLTPFWNMLPPSSEWWNYIQIDAQVICRRVHNLNDVYKSIMHYHKYIANITPFKLTTAA